MNKQTSPQAANKAAFFMSDINYRALQLLISKAKESDIKLKRTAKRINKLAKRGQLTFDKLPAAVQYSLCCARLTLGDFSDYTGWEYRNPWAVTFMRWGQDKKIDLWDGKPGKVFVLGEQGLGDEIMQASILPELARTNEVVLEAEPRLVEVFSRSFPEIEVIERRDLKSERDGKCIAMADLQRFYRRKRVHFPRVPFLKPDARRVTDWRNALRDLGPPPYIGIAWKARHGELDPDRLKTGTWVSLQYDDPDAIMDGKKDFADQINLIAALDKVQSVTQTVVHAAGALGTDCDVILDPRGFVENNLNHPWYYHGGEYMSWYPINVYRNLNEWQAKAGPKIQKIKASA